jgi:hypothetical protein
MKKVIVVMILAVFFVISTPIFASNSSQNNESILEKMIARMKSGPVGQTGATGAQGPIGPIGPPGLVGAGNVAFIRWIYDAPYVLTKGGETKTYQEDQKTWVPSSFAVIPVPIQHIVQWDVEMFLDREGNVWRYKTDQGWVNIGRP